jgi:hypothetical protein
MKQMYRLAYWRDGVERWTNWTAPDDEAAKRRVPTGEDLDRWELHRVEMPWAPVGRSTPSSLHLVAESN